jgi:ATP-dependent RNA helicase DDX42
MLQRIPSLKALAITGGNMGRYQLSQALLHQKPQLVVATPGRLLDVLSAQQKSKQEWLLHEITFLVLDEADKMLQLGFASQVTQILDGLRPDRQSLLTSATWHSRLERHCQQWMNQPTRVSVGRSGISSEHVQQHVMLLPSTQAKEAFLKEVLPTFCNVGRTIVFCARRDGCEQLAQVLAESGITHFQTLHGDKHPSDRQAALKAFTKGTVKLLVATDVAGRGLDIPKVATVINYDPAKNWDTHVHRIGRAGRLSEMSGQQEGSAYTLLTPANAEFAQTLVQAYRREGREISPEIERLANRSKQNSAGSTKKANRKGLGFEEEDGNYPNESSYYQPQKKSRWS